jgi:hypothetical protein
MLNRRTIMKQIRRTGDQQWVVDVELDEFEMHDLLCTLGQEIARRLGVEDEDSLGGFKIVPTDKEGRFTSELVTKWEQKLNDLLKQIYANDSEFHVDAEFTC